MSTLVPLNELIPIINFLPLKNECAGGDGAGAADGFHGGVSVCDFSSKEEDEVDLGGVLAATRERAASLMRKPNRYMKILQVSHVSAIYFTPLKVSLKVLICLDSVRWRYLLLNSYTILKFIGARK